MPRLRSRANLTAPSAAPTASSTRSRRNTANQAPPTAVIERSSPEERRQSMNLTVKASPGKLRQATRGAAAPTTSVSSRNIVAGKRASRSSRIVQEVDSDEDEEDEAEEVDAMDVDDEEEEEDEDAEGEEDDELDAEGEEEDEIDITPALAPRIVVSANKSVPVKPRAAQDSVEAKEMILDDDDEELSELDSDEDAEGEDEDAEGEDDDEIPVPNDDDEDMDSDDDISRGQTPDLSKMTRRQQAMITEGTDELISLSNEAQKKKHLTAEEHAMRRAEMARRRKNLSEKRNEEEKMDTINRLLKKQPPKRGRKAMQEINEFGQEEEPDVERANPHYIRYKQNANGTSLGVPDEWLLAPVGSMFTGTLAQPSKRPFSGRMVEEVS
ncbi:PAPA-1-domain-containing protein [Byssothecium circinans]|uniref:PAPA-1-domain-containing protein n=1 Tax=Byssothecium circinans TaxID=147558 RepID=A0A6A5TC03_9PLEO|nr:PAPA-1-domain-containing protein [Byssothecium circinans]